MTAPYTALLDLARRRVVRVCDVPEDLDSAVTRGSEEVATVDVEPLWNRMLGLYRAGVHPAVQVCVRHEGRIVLDRSVGHARGLVPGRSLDDAGVVPVTPTTPINLFSAAKALTGMVMHLLEEDGVIDLDAPVARYVPEFARNGKERITVRHVLTHRAGIPTVPRAAFDLDLLADHERVEAMVCDLRPSGAPGGAPAYHALTGGFVMDVVARRAAGAGMRELLTDRVKRPLRLGRFDFGVGPEDSGQVATNVCTGVPLTPPLSVLFQRLIGIDWDHAVRLSNDPRYVEAVVPSGNAIVTARDVAAFYQCLLDGGVANGVRVFEPATIERAVRADRPRAGVDRMIGIPMRYGAGFMLGTRTLSLFGWNHPRAFGHVGLANSFTWADPDRALAVAILTTGKAVVGTHIPALVQMMREIHRTFPPVG